MDQDQRFLGESMARSGEPPLLATSSGAPGTRQTLRAARLRRLTEPLHCLLLLCHQGRCTSAPKGSLSTRYEDAPAAASCTPDRAWPDQGQDSEKEKLSQPSGGAQGFARSRCKRSVAPRPGAPRRRRAPTSSVQRRPRRDSVDDVAAFVTSARSGTEHPPQRSPEPALRPSRTPPGTVPARPPAPAPPPAQ